MKFAKHIFILSLIGVISCQQKENVVSDNIYSCFERGIFKVTSINNLNQSLEVKLAVNSNFKISDFYFAMYEDVVSHCLINNKNQSDSIIFNYINEFDTSMVRTQVIILNQGVSSFDKESYAIKQYALDSLIGFHELEFEAIMIQLYTLLGQGDSLELRGYNYDFFHLLYSALYDIDNKNDKSCSITIFKGLNIVFEEKGIGSVQIKKFTTRVLNYGNKTKQVLPKKWRFECLN